MTQDEFKHFVSAGEAHHFVVHELFNNDCWLFNQPKLVAPGATYPKLRADLADLLGLMPSEIAVVGSGKYGWSMSPPKGMRAFNPATSDIDIAIVSGTIFNEAWSALRAAYYAGYSHYKEKHAAHVFARALVLDGEEKYRSAYLSDLAVRLSELNLIVNKRVRLTKPAQYRIYAAWDDARNYHTHGLVSFRKKIEHGNP